MFHKAIELKFLEGTELELKFQTGETKRYDMATLFSKYPQLRALEDRNLFLSGRLLGMYGISWNDELDIEAETVYEDGLTVSRDSIAPCMEAANAVLSARARKGMSQSELAIAAGIDRSDISKIECGAANPSVDTLYRIAIALDGKLSISISQ